MELGKRTPVDHRFLRAERGRRRRARAAGLEALLVHAALLEEAAGLSAAAELPLRCWRTAPCGQLLSSARELAQHRLPLARFDGRVQLREGVEGHLQAGRVARERRLPGQLSAIIIYKSRGCHQVVGKVLA